MEQGVVTAVNYTDGVVQCNVKPMRGSNDYPNVPVLKGLAGEVAVPEVNQKVSMLQLSDDTRFIVGVIARNGENGRPTEMSQGDYSLQFDSDTALLVSQTGSENYDVTLTGSANLSVSAPNGTVTIDGGDIELSADSILINGTPFSEHTHEYDDETISDTGDGSGSSSTTTRSTTPPQ